MNTKCKVLAMLFLFTMVCASGVYAQVYDGDIESLRGLKGVYVMIGDLKPDIEEDRLEKEQIQTDVELKLRLAGIKVLTREEYEKELGRPYLYVSGISMKREIGSHVFNTQVELVQQVQLTRNTKISLTTKTWSTSDIGYVGEKDVANYVRDAIKDGVDEFINDYLSVNPK